MTKYKYLFSVEEVNKLVLQGIPFRDAYKQVGMSIEEGKFNYTTDVNHVHEGSIGNLCNDKIQGMMQQTLDQFGFEKVHAAIDQLLKK
jgi:argininosuccinate lyase